MDQSIPRRTALAALTLFLLVAGCSSTDSAADGTDASPTGAATTTTAPAPSSAAGETNKLESGNSVITTSVRPGATSVQQATFNVRWNDAADYTYAAAGYAEANQVITHDYLSSKPGQLNIRTDYDIGFYLTNTTPQRRAPYPHIAAMPAWPTDSTVCRTLKAMTPIAPPTAPIANGQYCVFDRNYRVLTDGGKSVDSSAMIGANAVMPLLVRHEVVVTVDDDPALVKQVEAELAKPVFVFARNGDPKNAADTAYQHGCESRQNHRIRITEASVDGFVCSP